MPNWIIEAAQRRAFLPLLGGTLVVSRSEAGDLGAVWTSPHLDAELKSGLAHVGRFAITSGAVRALSAEQGSLILKAKWEGPHQPWEATEATEALELHLQGRAVMAEGGGVVVEHPGAACWIAPVAVRRHLAQVFAPYFEPFAADPPPGLFVADLDPI